MAIAEKIQSFLGIFKTAEDKQNKPLKPLKPIEYPAKILIIDCDMYDNYYYFEDFIDPHFSEEIQNNQINFWLARDFSEAAAQIQIDPPNLIICELVVLPLCELINDGEKNVVRNGIRFGYGLNLFKLLDKLDLEFRIPVIFYSQLGNYKDYKEKAKELGAFDCLKKDSQNNSKRKLKLAIQKALNI